MPAGGSIALAVRAVIVLILAVILASCGGSRSTPATSTSAANPPFRSQNTSPPNRFSPPAPVPPGGQGNEQYFIGDVRADTPASMDGPWVPWPDDQTLMSQGHEVCAILSTHGGAAAIEDSPPADLRQYAEGQLHWFIDNSTEDLCFEYSLSHLMNEPPSQALHAQKTMPPPAGSFKVEHDGAVDHAIAGTVLASDSNAAIGESAV